MRTATRDYLFRNMAAKKGKKIGLKRKKNLRDALPAMLFLLKDGIALSMYTY